MQIQVQNQQRKYPKAAIERLKAPISKALTEAWHRTDAARQPELEGADIMVSLSFVGSARIRTVNKETRDVNLVTDVLSFPAHALKEGRLEESPQVWDFEYLDSGDSHEDTAAVVKIFNLGDILISLEEAARQASEYGHSEEREIVYLAVHGFLHLLGYDHGHADEEERMTAEAETIMSRAGLERGQGNDVLTEAESGDLETPVQDLPEEGEAAEEADVSSDTALFSDELPEGFRSGFVAILGRPNTGKSTLLNRFAGTHLAITSAKAQTTRSNIRSIVNLPDAQLVFIDTPGLHKSRHKLDEFMEKSSDTAAADADVILLLLDAGRPQITEMEKSVVHAAQANGKPLVLAINKADTLPKPEILPTIARYSRLYDFQDIVPISAAQGDGTAELLDILKNLLPEGPRLFSEDDYTNQSERQLAAEYIREQILFYTHQEIPHGTAVLIDSFDEELKENAVDAYDRKIVRIHASILCDRDSHKGIIIGKNGQTLKRIASSARIRLEEMLGCKVYLETFVKVRPDWRNRQGILGSLGFAGGDSVKNS